MNWLQRIFTKAAARVLQLAPKFTRYAFGQFSWFKAVEGYQTNSAVFACVSALAFSFPEAPLVTGTETDGKFKADYRDPMMKLIRQPNLDMGEAEFMQYAVTYAAIGGSCYVWKQRNENGRVIAWWPFSDGQVTPIPGEDTSQGLVKHYEYRAGGGVEPIILPKDDVIQWKWMPDPQHPEKGMGGIAAAAHEVDKDGEANAYIYALLRNNAVPPIVITLTEGDELTTDKAKRLRAEWKTSHTGENAGTPAFLEAGMTVQKLGFDLQQLAGEALSGVPEARIAACLRVPPVVAGLSVGLKRSDFGDAAARRAFTELTLSALWRMFSSEIWNGMKDEFPTKPDNWMVQFNLRVVRALQDDETKVWERVTSAFERSLLTRAEAKTQLGIEPNAGDKVYKVSLASEFIPEGQDVVREADPAKTKAPSPRPSPNSKGEFGEGSQETKAKNSGVALRRIRSRFVKGMAAEVDAFFANLAEIVEERARGKSKASAEKLPTVDDLLAGDVFDDLGKIIKRYYAAILKASWDTWNKQLGLDIAFDLNDPLVVKIINMADLRLPDIKDTTGQALKDALAYAADQGWGIDKLLRGDPANGIPGLRDLIEETYKKRAETIARTELGMAQNAATAARYADAGVEKVVIMDNGAEDDDDECKIANGEIWSLAYFEDNFLEHPNCTRAAGAYFGSAEAVR